METKNILNKQSATTMSVISNLKWLFNKGLTCFFVFYINIKRNTAKFHDIAIVNILYYAIIYAIITYIICNNFILASSHS